MFLLSGLGTCCCSISIFFLSALVGNTRISDETRRQSQLEHDRCVGASSRAGGRKPRAATGDAQILLRNVRSARNDTKKAGINKNKLLMTKTCLLPKKNINNELLVVAAATDSVSPCVSVASVSLPVCVGSSAIFSFKTSAYVAHIQFPPMRRASRDRPHQLPFKPGRNADASFILEGADLCTRSF